ncbi:MAG: hypothetical protein OEO83_14730 [Alphaproteobacteria bacterium]|nr:hypothetical protein [Alphaproteobacteria bacterium]
MKGIFPVRGVRVFPKVSVSGLRRFGSICLVFTLLVLTKSHEAWGVQYKLSVASESKYFGGEPALCHDLKANLDQHPMLSRRPSEVPIAKNQSGLETIRWTNLDPKKNLGLIRHGLIRLYTGTDIMSEGVEERIWRRIGPKILEQIQKGSFGFGVSKIDVDNDGKVETIYRYGDQEETGSYPKLHRTYLWQYFVLPPDRLELNKLLGAFRHDSRLRQGADLFRYKKKTYIWHLRGRGNVDVLRFFKLPGRDNRIPELRCSFLAIKGTITEPTWKAREFRVFEGKETALCQTILGNLRSFSSLSVPMAELPIDPNRNDLKPIPWESVDPALHLDVFNEVKNHISNYPNVFKAVTAPQFFWLRPVDELFAKAKAGEIGVQRASFDINEDGKPETIYRVGAEAYRMPGPNGRKTYFWTYFRPGEIQTITFFLMWSFPQLMDFVRFRGKLVVIHVNWGAGGIQVRMSDGKWKTCEIYPVR